MARGGKRVASGGTAVASGGTAVARRWQGVASGGKRWQGGVKVRVCGCGGREGGARRGRRGCGVVHVLLVPLSQTHVADDEPEASKELAADLSIAPVSVSAPVVPPLTVGPGDGPGGAGWRPPSRGNPSGAGEPELEVEEAGEGDFETGFEVEDGNGLMSMRRSAPSSMLAADADLSDLLSRMNKISALGEGEGGGDEGGGEGATGEEGAPWEEGVDSGRRFEGEGEGDEEGLEGVGEGGGLAAPMPAPVVERPASRQGNKGAGLDLQDLLAKVRGRAVWLRLLSLLSMPSPIF